MITCPTCYKDDFETDGGMRQHHSKVHGERLPNNTCGKCGGEFYDSHNRKYCGGCSSQEGQMNNNWKGVPDHVEVTKEEWKEFSPTKRTRLRKKTNYNDSRNKRKRKLREWVSNIKSDRGCLFCEEDDSVCLIFHHHNDKYKGISQMVSDGYSKDRIIGEIKKCVVLCSTCHRKVHADKLNVERKI